MKEHYKGIGHIAIYTVDMDQSIAFYEMIGGSVFKRDGVETPEGLKKLALVEFGGFLLELIEPPAGTLVPSGEGSIPHFAVYVDDLDKTVADLKAAGVIPNTSVCIDGRCFLCSPPYGNYLIRSYHTNSQFSIIQPSSD